MKLPSFLKNKTFLIIAALFVGLFLLIAREQNIENKKRQEEELKLKNLAQLDEEDAKKREREAFNNKIRSAVVNVFCRDSGGSGTIFSEDGYILTNAHIIPDNFNYLPQSKQYCLITTPDPTTGAAKEMFVAIPEPDITGFGKEYDIAFLEIIGPYEDENGIVYGEFPKKFNFIDVTKGCFLEKIKLGDPVRVLGYPAISGGYSLTITDGIVSSLPGDGLIITSAKIDQGNSGGLAISNDNCMIGIPSLVIRGEMESLGVITSMDLIGEFVSKESNE